MQLVYTLLGKPPLNCPLICPLLTLDNELDNEVLGCLNYVRLQEGILIDFLIFLEGWVPNCFVMYALLFKYTLNF